MHQHTNNGESIRPAVHRFAVTRRHVTSSIRIQLWRVFRQYHSHSTNVTAFAYQNVTNSPSFQTVYSIYQYYADRTFVYEFFEASSIDTSCTKSFFIAFSDRRSRLGEWFRNVAPPNLTLKRRHICAWNCVIESWHSFLPRSIQSDEKLDRTSRKFEAKHLIEVTRCVWV